MRLSVFERDPPFERNRVVWGWCNVCACAVSERWHNYIILIHGAYAVVCCIKQWENAINNGMSFILAHFGLVSTFDCIYMLSELGEKHCHYYDGNPLMFFELWFNFFLLYFIALLSLFWSRKKKHLYLIFGVYVCIFELFIV